MNKTIFRAASVVLLVGALTIPASAVFAGSDYLVLQGAADLRVGDAAGYTNRLIMRFDLPANAFADADPADLDLDLDPTRMAVLQLTSRNVKNPTNEVYINPPSLSCSVDSADLNNAASVHYIEEHDPTTKSLREYYSNHKVFSHTLLKPGQENILMICARNANGTFTPAGSVDDLLIRKIVLHYQTIE